MKTKDEKAKGEKRARPRRIKKNTKKRLGVGTRQAYQKLGKVLEEGQAGETIPYSACLVCALYRLTEALGYWRTERQLEL